MLGTNWLYALSSAATYRGAIRAGEVRVPLHQRAMAQGVLGAANAGFGMLYCGLVGGFAFEVYEGGAIYFMAGCAAIGVCLAIWLRRTR